MAEEGNKGGSPDRADGPALGHSEGKAEDRYPVSYDILLSHGGGKSPPT